MADLLSSEEYSKWLRENRDKRGTREYATVSKAAMEAYRLERQGSVLGRTAMGAGDVAAGIAQLVPRAAEFVTSGAGYFPNPVSEAAGKGREWIDRQVRQREQEYQTARQMAGATPEDVDIARGVGQVFSPVNLTLARAVPLASTIPGRIATGAAAGGISGLTQPVTSEEGQADYATQKLLQTGTGVTVGAVAQPTLGLAIEKLGPKIAGFLAKQGPRLADLMRGEKAAPAEFNYNFYARQAVDDTLSEIDATPETFGRSQYEGLVSQVEDSLRTGRPLDVAAITRQRDFERLGMQPTLGQITRDPRQYATERNLAQVQEIGDPLLQRLQQQSATLQERLGQFAGGAEAEQVAGVALGTQLRNLDKRLGLQVSELYNQARESTGRSVEIPTGGFASDVGKIMQNYRGRIPPAIVTRLNEYGFLGPKQTKVFDFGEADDFIQLINQYFGENPATDSALKAIRKSVQTAIEKAPMPDAFAAARLAASQRFKLQESLPALEEAVSNPRGDEQLVQKFIIRGNARDVNALANFLKTNSPDLYNQMKLQLGQYIQRAAFGENVAGDKAVAAESLARAIRQLGGRQKLKAFFTDEEILDLEAASRVAGYMVSPPAFAPVNYSGSGAALFNLAQQVPTIGERATLLRNLVRPVIQQRQVTEALRATPTTQPGPTTEAARRAAILATMGTAGNVAPR